MTYNVMMNIAILFCDCAVPMDPDVVTKTEGRVCLQAFRDIQFRECKDEEIDGEISGSDKKPDESGDSSGFVRMCENFDEWRAAFKPLEIPCWKVTPALMFEV